MSTFTLPPTSVKDSDHTDLKKKKKKKIVSRVSREDVCKLRSRTRVCGAKQMNGKKRAFFFFFFFFFATICSHFPSHLSSISF